MARKGQPPSLNSFQQAPIPLPLISRPISQDSPVEFVGMLRLATALRFTKSNHSLSMTRVSDSSLFTVSLTYLSIPPIEFHRPDLCRAYYRSIRRFDCGEIPGCGGQRFEFASCRGQNNSDYQAMGQAASAGDHAVGGVCQEHGDRAVGECGYSGRAEPGHGHGDEDHFLEFVQVPERSGSASAHAGCRHPVAERGGLGR